MAGRWTNEPDAQPPSRRRVLLGWALILGALALVLGAVALAAVGHAVK